LTSRINQIVDAVFDTLILVNQDGVIEWCNASIGALLSYQPQELIGRPIEILMPLSQRNAHVAKRRDYIKEPDVREMGKGYVLNALSKDGREIPVDIALSPMEMDCQAKTLVTLRSNLERMVMQRQHMLFDSRLASYQGSRAGSIARQRAEQRLMLTQAVYEHCSEGVLILDKQFRVLAANPSYQLRSGFSEWDLLNLPVSVIFAHSKPEELERQLDLQLSNNTSFCLRQTCRLKDAGEYPALCAFSPVGYSQERPAVQANSGGAYTRQDDTYFVLSVTDISALELAQSRLENLAHFDQLTQLPNRTLFARTLTQWGDENRAGEKLAVLYIDLDGFKQVNDTQGHAAGDQVLELVAQRISRVTSEDIFAARLGGDEFALLIRRLPLNSGRAGEIARSLIELLQIQLPYMDCALNISSSIGISYFPVDSDQLDDLLSHADQAMYEAKGQGRNTFHYYQHEQREKQLERIRLSAELRQALDNHEFYTVYQPTYQAVTCRIGSAEALLRWNSPLKGMVGPDVFIPLAEENGLIIELGRYVIRDSCQFLASWLAVCDGSQTVAVNLSARQFHDPQLLDVIKQALIENRLDGSSLILEITESVVMEDVKATLDILKDLKTLGLAIAIDDFGTGYSSLSYLKHLPVDIIKVDRSFVGSIPDSRDDCAIVTAIISMARSLGLKVVAEGVETQAQLEFLEALQCDVFQGYYFSRPLGAEEVRALSLSAPVC
jgi:diguanylate cyclase (GGDEF)-like protein/PAS domain S-box-containing protein